MTTHLINDPFANGFYRTSPIIGPPPTRVCNAALVVLKTIKNAYGLESTRFHVFCHEFWRIFVTARIIQK